MKLLLIEAHLHGFPTSNYIPTINSSPSSKPTDSSFPLLPAQPPTLCPLEEVSSTLPFLLSSFPPSVHTPFPSVPCSSPTLPSSASAFPKTRAQQPTSVSMDGIAWNCEREITLRSKHLASPFPLSSRKRANGLTLCVVHSNGINVNVKSLLGQSRRPSITRTLIRRKRKLRNSILMIPG
jgi:hypothetical protein